MYGSGEEDEGEAVDEEEEDEDEDEESGQESGSDDSDRPLTRRQRSKFIRLLYGSPLSDLYFSFQSCGAQASSALAPSCLRSGSNFTISPKRLVSYFLISKSKLALYISLANCTILGLATLD